MRFTVISVVWLIGVVSVSAQSPDRVPAEGGDIVITPIIHSSAQVEHAGRVIHVDPWSVGDLSQAKPADLILVTDDPEHHLDPAAIALLRKPGAPVVLTETAHARFPDGTILSNGQSGVFADIRVEAVGAYDPGFPIWLWYFCPFDQSSSLEFRGFLERHQATEGDTQWVNYKRSPFSSRSTDF